MTTDELFGRCVELAKCEPGAAANRFMHETLVLCCAEGLKSAGMGFGNLFSQVDYLCKHCRMRTPERIAVQLMRRHSNHSDVPDLETWMQDVRSLSLFVSAVCKADIPDTLTRLLPHWDSSLRHVTTVNAHYLRCIVSHWNEQTITADTEDGKVKVDYSEHLYLKKMLREGMQLNLLDSHIEPNKPILPGVVVVEPDFLVDISAVARCFQGNYGHHPLLYTVERLKPRGNSQAMLLGNFAGAALDDVIKDDKKSTLNGTLNDFFREQALQFVTCEDFNTRQFIDDAIQQTEHIKEAVETLFASDYDRTKALLEPSFVCERLGLQGRVDLMTSDMQLLVEQKSGKNYSIEREYPRQALSSYKEEHYVQLLLYYGILRYNFGRTDNQVDIRLLYSRYPAMKGLLYVNFYSELFYEAIKLRNQIVATEMLIAREGFGRILPLLTPDVIFKEIDRDSYFTRYVEPPLSTIARNLKTVNPTERAYFERMMTFVYREQLLSKVGRQEGQGGAVCDLWNMPTTEKIETGNIIMAGEEDSMPNFRRGDMVYLYNYDVEPDVRKNILYKGTLSDLKGSKVEVQLNEGFNAEDVMSSGKWAIEHASSDQNTTSAIKGLYQFVTANASKKALLLGGRSPQADTSIKLSRSYHPHYDDVLLRAKQARDYYLLVGPPGTGKTSMALRFLVEEELLSRNEISCTPTNALLLMAYTNRAVDEICAMLENAGLNYIRIGNATSCDPRFADHLLEAMLGEKPKLDAIKQVIEAMPVIVGTTSMLQARPFIFQIKHFSLCIVDEASQILEPGIVGILASDHIDRFILMGDHKQLPAVVQQTEQESHVNNPLLTAIGITDCRHSLFERLVHWEQRQGRTQFTGILRKQGRMHPDIAEFPNQMFYQNEQLEPVPLPHQSELSLSYDLPSDDAVDDILKQRRVVFFDSMAYKAHDSHGPHWPPPHSDKVNPTEAHIVADLLRRIRRFYGERFDPDKTVGVIVPYRNQIAMIRHEIEKTDLPELQHVSIDTVERYQGSQRDVIVYSFTVSRPYQLDFLTSNCFEEMGYVIDRKLNVAMTRARKQLLMTGNVEICCQNKIFEQLITRYKENLY